MSPLPSTIIRNSDGSWKRSSPLGNRWWSLHMDNPPAYRHTVVRTATQTVQFSCFPLSRRIILRQNRWDYNLYCPIFNVFKESWILARLAEQLGIDTYLSASAFHSSDHCIGYSHARFLPTLTTAVFDESALLRVGQIFERTSTTNLGHSG